MKKIFILAVTALSIFTSGQPVQATLTWDWNFPDNNVVLSPTEDFYISGTVYNNSASNEPVKITAWSLWYSGGNVNILRFPHDYYTPHYIDRDPGGLFAGGDYTFYVAPGQQREFSIVYYSPVTPLDIGTTVDWHLKLFHKFDSSDEEYITKTVTLTIALPQHTLSVNVDGSGTVSNSPAPDMTCTNNCTQNFNEGTVVTLTADPATNYDFTGWTGECSGSDNCFVTMDAAKNVTATFSVNNIPYPAMREDTQETFTSIQTAYDSVPLGQTATIKAKAGDQASGDLYFDRDVTFKLKGGYNDIFTDFVSYTLLYGTLTISGGPVTVSNLIIK
jgi:uncharacterized repeat protein (TIGR02543 family)